MGLMDAVGPGPIALDTAVFIYYIEQDPRYRNLVEPLFDAIDRGDIGAVTSGVTLLEVLVTPYRAGNLWLASQYEDLLTHSRGLRLVDLDRAILRQAAVLRASLRIKTPDALQVSAAIACDCSHLVTNDRAIPSVGKLRVLQLKDFG